MHCSIPRWLVAIWLIMACCGMGRAELNDWAEGTPGNADGATRDYYNRAGRLAWQNYLGDWRDARDVPQGDDAYATATIADDDTPKHAEWNVTSLVREWLQGTGPNQGLLLRGVDGRGPVHFRSREVAAKDQQPQLVVTTTKGTQVISPQADTYLEPSTYRSQGNSDTLRVGRDANRTLLRFDLSGLDASAEITAAKLKLFTHAQYGGGNLVVGVFRCSQGHDLPQTDPVVGLAQRYPGDRGIQDNPDVHFAVDFESPTWRDGWSRVAGTMDLIKDDAARRFQPLLGQALRVKIAEGSNAALNVTFKFQEEIGEELDDVYLRYYLRLAHDWNQTVEGGKLPGISGTYGIAGWGGRKSDGTNGWSARGGFHRTIGDGNPLAGRTPIGTYCYHADQPGYYGDIWLWQKGYRGFLEPNRWYCVEQYLKLNTAGDKDGVLRAWIDGRLAFEKTDIRFRHVDRLRIEQVWMNVYHGGKKPSPYDQHLYIDNVVIARQYVGPLRAR